MSAANRNSKANTNQPAHSATIDVTIDASDTKHLERIVGAIRKVSGIHDVTRILKV